MRVAGRQLEKDASREGGITVLVSCPVALGTPAGLRCAVTGAEA